MATYCRHGHEQTPENHRARSGWRSCRMCVLEERRRARAKRVSAGKWWEFHTVQPLSTTEIKDFARRLAHGECISEITTGTKRTHKTALYHRWMVWRNLHPEIGKRLRRLSIENKFARVRATNEKNRLLALVPWVVTPPPDDMWAIIDAIVPRQLFPELRMEICQRLAIDVLERRCECTPDGLRHALWSHRGQYYRDYASRWGNRSLDEQLPNDSRRTLGDVLSGRLSD
jgi:hypothetical protein